MSIVHKYGENISISFFFFDCLLRQIWRFWKWKWKYFDSRKFYFHFLLRPSLQSKWNILQVKFSSQVLYLFKTWSHLESLGVTFQFKTKWNSFPDKPTVYFLLIHKVPLNLLCEAFFPLITEIIWSHNNNPFQKINQLLEPLKYILRFILSKI